MHEIMVLVMTVGAVFMAGLAMFIRFKAIKRPASVKKIIIPPLFMSTGFFMFLYEPARPDMLQVIEALALGVICSFFLIRTSKFEVKEQQIYLQRSKAFAFLLIGLLVVRIVAKLVLGAVIDVEELAGMFFLLAYGMILPWRIAMLWSFKKLEREMRTRSIELDNVPVRT